MVQLSMLLLGKGAVWSCIVMVQFSFVWLTNARAM